MAELSPKQERFCAEYLIDYNATRAAIRAGYGEKSAGKVGSKLLQNAAVITYIHKKQGEILEHLCLDAEFVIVKILDIYKKCMTAVPVMEWDREKKQYVESGNYQFDSKGALKCLELIGKYLGMFDGKEEKEAKVITVNLGDAAEYAQ